MYKDWTYQEAITKSDSLHNLGIEELYLHDEFNNLPWGKVVEVKPGGSHRLDISTDVWIKAYDEQTKLVFKWTFSIESSSANGKGYYEVDVKSCGEVMKRLSGKAKIDFIDYLSDCANKLLTKGKEWNEIANKQYHDASVLQSLITM